jgi:hypothetical protein
MLQKTKIRNRELQLEVEKTDRKCLEIMRAREEIVALVKTHDPGFKDVG